MYGALESELEGETPSVTRTACHNLIVSHFVHLTTSFGPPPLDGNTCSALEWSLELFTFR